MCQVGLSLTVGPRKINRKCKSDGYVERLYHLDCQSVKFGFTHTLKLSL